MLGTAVMRVAVATVLAALSIVAVGAGPTSAGPARVVGVVDGGDGPLADFEVTLEATRGLREPAVLGTATTGADGTFAIDFAPDADPDSVYVLQARRGPVDLAWVSPEPPTEVRVTPLTTVGTAYAMAQFHEDGRISGPHPGLANAAAMARNVFDPRTGGPADVLVTAPNGDETETWATVGSLANAVAGCVADASVCTDLFAATASSRGQVADDTFEALDQLVVEPALDAAGVFAAAQAPPASYAPALTAAPVAWTVALRFAGDGASMNGPGNFAVDHEGTLWVVNNYAPEVDGASCGSQQLLRFTPSGEFVPGSPYTGGGVDGGGYGVTIDPYGDVWVGNFGFASPGCTEQPPHNSVSQFRGDGTPVSPAVTGWTGGGISWPQGTVSDATGTIWMANCESDVVTRIPGGDPMAIEAIDGLGLEKPFDIAFDAAGNAYVTGTQSDNVAVLRPDGTPAPGSPISGGAFKRPMGIASDPQGELWVANSGFIDLPCPKSVFTEGPGASVTHIAEDGSTTVFTGGGMTIPWGISVDGNGNVWVANFGKQRISVLCGRDDSPHCPPGARRGTPLSPDGTGFPFSGLVRNTASITDTAGNVWFTNNWLDVPVQTAPGGHEIVAFLGMAGPVQPPAPKARPVAPDRPGPPAAPPAVPVPGPARFTG